MMYGQQNQSNIFNLPTLAGQDWPSLPSMGGTSPYGTPPIAPTAGEGDAPMGSFLWGDGGSRLTPEQMEMQQKIAAANQQIDYSPVGHWTQGLARVAQNVVGGLQQGRLDKQSAAMQSDRDKIIAALSGGDAQQPSAVAAALASPDKAVQSLGMAQWERANPKPVNNDTVQDYQFRVQTLGKGAADEWLRRGNDPFITATTPGGFYAGPQSGFASAMGGGSMSMPPQAGPNDVPMGSPLDPGLAGRAPVTKTIGGKTYYQIGGDWYDNPEGR